MLLYFRKWQSEFRRAENCWYIIPVFSWLTSLKTKISLLFILATNCANFFAQCSSVLLPRRKLWKGFEKSFEKVVGWEFRGRSVPSSQAQGSGLDLYYCRGDGEMKERKRKNCPFLIIPETSHTHQLHSHNQSLSSLSLHTHTCTQTPTHACTHRHAHPSWADTRFRTPTQPPGTPSPVVQHSLLASMGTHRTLIHTGKTPTQKIKI